MGNRAPAPTPARPHLESLADELEKLGVDYDLFGAQVRCYRYAVSVVVSDGEPEYLIVEIAGQVNFARSVEQGAAAAAAWLAEHCP